MAIVHPDAVRSGVLRGVARALENDFPQALQHSSEIVDVSTDIAADLIERMGFREMHKGFQELASELVSTAAAARVESIVDRYPPGEMRRLLREDYEGFSRRSSLEVLRALWEWIDGRRWNPYY
jgi:hypothetical protein